MEDRKKNRRPVVLDMPKPQEKFSVPIDNSIGPFKPVLSSKPNSLMNSIAYLPVLKIREDGSKYYRHPYQEELNLWKPSDNQMQGVVPLKPAELKETPFDLVTSPSEVQKMLKDLKAAKEIAVDLEHHDRRSYLGYTCLIQISTRTNDYIIDGLALHRKLECLNIVFTDPKITKVFHGGSCDILWLQRDFGLYVVGMFDTSIAGEYLYGKKVPLKYFLEEYAGVTDVDKSLQLEDWRIRPLRDDMIHYARMDTHYLLYTFDCLKQILIKSGQLADVYKMSNERCLTLYDKPSNSPKTSLQKLEKEIALNSSQWYAYNKLYKWRDCLARELDESAHYILSNKSLELLVQTLPSDETSLTEILESDRNVPISSQVFSNIGIVLGIIAEAKKYPTHKEGTVNLLACGVNDITQRLNLLKVSSAESGSTGQSSSNGTIVKDIRRTCAKNTECESRDFRTLPVLPRVRELFSSEKNFLRANVVVGSYPNAEDYLDVQFRLIREDFLRSVKEGLKTYRAGKSPSKGVKVHNSIVLLRQSENKRIWTLELPKYLMDLIKSDESGRFLPGSLLFFTNDNFKNTFIGVINYSNKTLEESKGIFTVMLNGTLPHLRWVERQTFFTVECDQYFEPYRSTMTALKMNDWLYKLPLSKYLMNGCGDVGLPKYLSARNSLSIGSVEVDPRNTTNWPDAEGLGFDTAQYKAFQAALTREFVIIQGPPGTGKTYLGLQVIKTLMEPKNVVLWKANGGGPILIVCYTNHALDQFGEGILDMYTPDNVKNSKRPYKVLYPRIYRVGMRSQSTRLMSYKPPLGWKGSNVDIVLMTTTGASMRISKLLKMKSRIMIIEEAAEVIESHIVACFTPHIEHLILLGDHQQLRPITATSELSRQYFLDVSLFERMVKNEFPRYQLEVQHRMRPQIRNLITGTIYPKLRDHPNVHAYPAVSGMAYNLYFVDHQNPESDLTGDSFSRSNKHEASFLAALCAYLLNQGYKKERITVLAMYMSQVKLLEKEIWGIRNIPKDLRIETADSFQGEESDIILLSLVRSNAVNNIGFMRTDNRICVALSRAKHGLYIIGNMNLLAANSNTWKMISVKLRNEKRIGPKLTLVRKQGQRDIRTEVSKAVDFPIVMQENKTRKCRNKNSVRVKLLGKVAAMSNIQERQVAKKMAVKNKSLTLIATTNKRV